MITNNVNSKKFKNWIRSTEPDFIVSSNSLIFDSELIKIPEIQCLNRHSALLPTNKGILPIFRSIELNHSFMGVTIHKMTEMIDAGDIVSQFAFPIYKNDSLQNLYKVSFDISYFLIVQALFNYKISRKSISPYNESYHSFPKYENWRNFNRKKIPFI